MDAQAEQLKQWVGRSEALSAENKKLKTTVAEQKRILNAAKKACKKKGRCFQSQRTGRRRSAARFRRESCGNCAASRPTSAASGKRKDVPAVEKSPAPETAIDRYAKWIAQHEPDAAALETQRASAATLTGSTKDQSAPADTRHAARFSR